MRMFVLDGIESRQGAVAVAESDVDRCLARELDSATPLAGTRHPSSRFRRRAR